MPLKVSHAHRLHYDVMARRDSWRISDGRASRRLLSGLLLASLCHSLSARHEFWSNGSGHCHYICGENVALAAARALCHGCRARAFWGAGDCVTSTASHLPERWQCRYARGNADDDAPERQRTCHEVAGRVQHRCPLTDIQFVLTDVCFLVVKRTCVTSWKMSAK